MDWLKRWQDGATAWHKNNINARLVKHLPNCQLVDSATVFVPLCGKSLDMLYFLDNGYKVIGVELSDIAVLAFFRENNIVFNKNISDNFIIYSADNIVIYVGDYFKLTKEILADISFVYDRAALIALPAPLRIEYTKYLFKITPNNLTILLLTMNYPQHQLAGPPFAVAYDEVANLFNDYASYKQLECYDDIKNEQKFAAVDFLEKASYLIHKKC